jgi:hypothetical protein
MSAGSGFAALARRAPHSHRLRPSRYELPRSQWTQSSFMQPQMMVQDRYFYDPVAGRYTVDRYLDDLEKRYGGIDAVLVWATYPNMGIDDRNQLEMVESMPGGVEGVRQMVADFHRRGVRVLFPHDDVGRGHARARQPWPHAIAALMKQIDADGINGDTQDGVPLGFSLAAEKIGHPLAFEPEGSPSDEAWLERDDWGQYNFPFIPMVDRYKWLETRHMVNISDRWNAGQDQRSAIRLLQRRGLGELGERVGHLERHQSRATPRPRGAWPPSSAGLRRSWSARLGAALSHAQLRRLRQPLAAGTARRCGPS